MAEYKSICRSCFHSYVCEQFNEHRECDNKKCHFANDHFVSAADVVEVRHGVWIDRKEIFSEYEGEVYAIGCSVCGKSQKKYRHTNYCPNCGAKMDGKDGAE